MLAKLSALHIAFLVSLGLHGALLTLRIVDPERFNRIFQDTALEVVLVNTRSNEAPVKAAALAQANLAGGGDADAGRATSPLPPSKLLEVGDAVEVQHAQIAQLQAMQLQLLAQLRREVATYPAPDPVRDRSSREARDEAEKRRIKVDQLAEIEKRVNAENARPRKRYISPATKEVVYARYYDSLRTKIEDRGTRNFPEYQGRKLYGALIVNVHVDYRGRVVETEIVTSSGIPNLDRRAVAIVHAASPFGGFSKEMRSEAEVLVMTWRFRFGADDSVEAKPSTVQRQ